MIKKSYVEAKGLIELFSKENFFKFILINSFLNKILS